MKMNRAKMRSIIKSIGFPASLHSRILDSVASYPFKFWNGYSSDGSVRNTGSFGGIKHHNAEEGSMQLRIEYKLDYDYVEEVFGMYVKPEKLTIAHRTRFSIEGTILSEESFETNNKDDQNV